MHNPAHAGEILKEYLGDLSLTKAAENLGISRSSLSRIIKGKQAINAELAIKLAEFLPNTKPEFWLTLQNNYDLWIARQKPHNLIKPIYQFSYEH